MPARPRRPSSTKPRSRPAAKAKGKLKPPGPARTKTTGKASAGRKASVRQAAPSLTARPALDPLPELAVPALSSPRAAALARLHGAMAVVKARTPAAPAKRPFYGNSITDPGPGKAMRTAVLAGVAVLILVAALASAQVLAQGNSGTVKIHVSDEPDGPDTRNEPHVDCEDFWVEGFNMAVDSGVIHVYSWPPTGDKTLVLEAEWAADDEEPEFHFEEGPFTLEPGHYRAEVSNAERNDGETHFKSKMFWVEPCEAEEEPPCGEPGGEPCPPVPCGEPGGEPCPPCGEPGGEPCPEPCEPGDEECPIPCGEPGGEPCPPCGEPGGEPCPPIPCGEPGGEPCPVEITCPSGLAAVANDDGTIAVTWTVAEGSDGTNLYRAVGDGDFEYVDTFPPDVTSYTDEDTGVGQGYAYMVTGLFGNQESEGCPIVEATAIPELPTLVALGLAVGGGALAFVLPRRKAGKGDT